MKNDDFILFEDDKNKENVEFYGIPFCVGRKDEEVKSLAYSLIHANDSSAVINKNCEALFFLGMTTEKPEGSEWWGQNERYHYHGQRLFIGDRLINLEPH